jgi:hypothetical protein
VYVGKAGVLSSLAPGAVEAMKFAQVEFKSVHDTLVAQTLLLGAPAPPAIPGRALE